MYKSSTYKINRFKKIKKHNQVKQEINEGASTWTWGHLTSEPGTHAGVGSRQEIAGSAASGGWGRIPSSSHSCPGHGTWDEKSQFLLQSPSGIIRRTWQMSAQRSALSEQQSLPEEQVLALLLCRNPPQVINNKPLRIFPTRVMTWLFFLQENNSLSLQPSS